jgi:hypothetical protein
MLGGNGARSLGSIHAAKKFRCNADGAPRPQWRSGVGQETRRWADADDDDDDDEIIEHHI